MEETSKVVIASAPGTNVAELVKQAADAGIEVEVKETESLQDVAETVESESLQDLAEQPIDLDENGQKIFSIVQEITDLFKDRVSKGELSPYDVAEGLAITLSGTIYSTVPPQHHKTVSREAESLTQKTLKAFDRQVQKKNYMFAAQLLGAAKVSSYVMSHGNNILKEFRKGQAEAFEKAKAEVESKMVIPVKEVE